MLSEYDEETHQSQGFEAQELFQRITPKNGAAYPGRRLVPIFAHAARFRRNLNVPEICPNRDPV